MASQTLVRRGKRGLARQTILNSFSIAPQMMKLPKQVMYDSLTGHPLIVWYHPSSAAVLDVLQL